MKQSWTMGLNEEQEANLRKEYASSPFLRERLKGIINDKLDVSRKETRSKRNYENPSWAYAQADQIGYERALFEIISLIVTKSVD